MPVILTAKYIPHWSIFEISNLLYTALQMAIAQKL